MRFRLPRASAILFIIFLASIVFYLLLPIMQIVLGQELTDSLQTLDALAGIISIIIATGIWVNDYFEEYPIPAGIHTFDKMFPKLPNEEAEILREPIPHRIDFEMDYVVISKKIGNFLLKKLAIQSKNYEETPVDRKSAKAHLQQAVLAGPSGSGKTTTAFRFAYDLATKNGWCVFYSDIPRLLSVVSIGDIGDWLQTLRGKNLIVLDNVHLSSQQTNILLDVFDNLLTNGVLRFRSRIRILYVETITYLTHRFQERQLPTRIKGKRIAVLPMESTEPIGLDLTDTHQYPYQGVAKRKPTLIIESGLDIAKLILERFIRAKRIEEKLDFDEMFSKTGNVAGFCEILRWVEDNANKPVSQTPYLPPNLPRFTLNRHLSKIVDRELGALALGILSTFSSFGSVVSKEFIDKMSTNDVSEIVDSLLESQLVHQVFVGPAQKQLVILTHPTIAGLVQKASLALLQDFTDSDIVSEIYLKLIEKYIDYLRSLPPRTSKGIESTFLLVLSTYINSAEDAPFVDVIFKSCKTINQSDSNIIYCLHNLGSYYLRNGNLDEAEDILRYAISLDEEFYQGRMNLGVVLLLGGKLKQALKQCEIAMSMQPNDASVYANLSNILWELNKRKSAIEHVERAIELAPQTSRYWYMHGKMLLEESLDEVSVKAALQKIREAIKLDPFDVEFYVGLSHHLININSLADAESVINDAIGRNLESSDLMINLGVIFKKTERPEQARVMFEKALELDSSSILARLNLCDYFINIGEVEQASIHINEVLKNEEEVQQNPMVHALHGLVLHKQKQYEASIKAFENSLRLGFEKPEIHLNLAIAYYETDNPEKSYESYKHVSQIATDRTQWCIPFVIYLLSKQDLSLAQKCLSDMSHEEAANSNLAQDYTKILKKIATESLLQRKREIAEFSLKRLAKIEPDSFEAWLNLGAVRIHLGRFRDAKEATLKALEINPDSPYAWHNLGRIYEELDEKEESRNAYIRAKELDEKSGEKKPEFDPSKGWNVT